MDLTKLSWFAVASLSLVSYAAYGQSDFYLFGAIDDSNPGLDLGAGTIIRTRVDDGDVGFRLGGGYEFNDNLALEAAYQGFGELTGQNRLVCGSGLVFPLILFPGESKIEAYGLSVALVASFRIGKRMACLGSEINRTRPTGFCVRLV